MFDTPILFLIFNRPDTTQKVFAEIRKQQPKYLFVAADGAREDKEGEKEKCEQARRIVIDNIDWDCEVKTLFREQNLGCGRAVSSAITWFFEHVEQGIILEDDCLPTQSFFSFCSEMLDRYKLDQRISTIAGANILDGWEKDGASYLFSFHAGIWGWATWKRVWDEYDLYIKKWANPAVVDLFSHKIPNLSERNIYQKGFDRILAGDVFTWDFQLVFLRIITSRFGIIPKNNMITNIGFRQDATNTLDADSPLAELPSREMNFPLHHPAIIMVDEEYERKLSNMVYIDTPTTIATTKQSLIRKILNKAIHIFKPK
jgi:hypothetical protein